MAWCQGYHVGYEPIVKDELHDGVSGSRIPFPSPLSTQYDYFYF